MILYWLGSVFTISANLLLCFAYCKDPFRELQTVQNFYVLNLGIADLVMGAIAEPLLAITYWEDRDAVYLAHYLFAIISGACSLLNITALAIIRYFAVVHPLHHQNIVNRKTVLTSITFIWAISVHYAIIPLLGWQDRYFQIYLYSFGCILPTLAFLLAYCKVYLAIREHTKCVENLTSGRNNQLGLRNAIRREKAASKTVLLVLVIFVICWVPFLAIDFAMVQCARCRDKRFHLVRDIALTMVYFSSGVNPLVYAWRVKSFRRAFVQVTGLSQNHMITRRRALFYSTENKVSDQSNVAVRLTSFKHVSVEGIARMADSANVH